MKAVRAPKPIVMEPMSAAGRSRAACVKCGLCSNPSPFVEGYVPDGYTGEYLFILDYPHMEFARTGNPYEGMTGEVLRDAMQDAGLRRKQVAVMPALRCQPLLTGSKKPKITSLRACAPFLYRALHQLQAPRVLVLGEAAAKSLLNSSRPARIVKLRGRVQTLETEGNTYQWWVTYSIHDALKNPQTYTRLVEDIDRFEWPLTPHPGNTPPKNTKAVGFDSEFWEDEVFCGAVSDGKTSVVYPVSDWKKKLPPLLDGKVFIGHQPAVDLEALLKKGVKLKSMELWLQGKKQRDTILEAKLADENRGKDGYRLENLLLSDYRTDSWKVDTEAYGVNSSLWPPDLRNERCRLDAWATVLAHEAALDRIEGPSQMCHAIAMTLRRIFHTGVYLDEKTVKRMHRVVAQNKEEARKEVMAWVTERFGWDEFDPGKDAQVRELLYDRDKLGLPIKARTKAGLPSADAKRLKEASETVPELAQVLRYNKYDKLDSTYCASLAEKFQRQPDGRLWMPVRINPLAAKTGRRASDSPNLQNWPVSVRRIIVSRFKDGVIADNDYSKLEPVLGGWVTGEHRLSEYFTKHENGYIKIGEDFFKTTVDKKSDQYRAIKALVLAIIYNQKKWSLAENLWIVHGVRLDSSYERHQELAGEMLDKFLTDLFPGIIEYQERQEAFVLEHGYVTNALGQKRRLPLPPEPPRSEKEAYRKWCKYRAHVVNQAINGPIQGLASYVTGAGMIDLERRFLEEYKLSYEEYHVRLMEKRWPTMPLLCIEVHDDLVLDIPGKLAEKTTPVVHEVMSEVPSLRAILSDLNVTLKIETNIGPCWGMKQ